MAQQLTETYLTVPGLRTYTTDGARKQCERTTKANYENSETLYAEHYSNIKTLDFIVCKFTKHVLL